MASFFNFLKLEPNVEGIQRKIKTLTDELKGIKVNGEDLFTYLNNYVLLVTLFAIIGKSTNILFTPVSGSINADGGQWGYRTELYEFLEDVKDINHPPPYISNEEYFRTGDPVSYNVIIDIINNHIDKYNTLVPLIKNNKIGFRNIIKGKIKGFLNKLETLMKECYKHKELSQTMEYLEEYKYGLNYINKDEDFEIKQKIEKYHVPDTPNAVRTEKLPIDEISDILKGLVESTDTEIQNYIRGLNENDKGLIKTIISGYKSVLCKEAATDPTNINNNDINRKIMLLLLKYEHLLYEKLGGGGKYKMHSKKEILGKMRCIYKKEGDRKEYIKHKGNFITLRKFREYNKQKK
jgi:hypothetical protein